jgi:hypothetical protein
MFTVPNFFEEEVNVYKPSTSDEDEAWGILSDINDNYGDEDFSWLTK